MKIKALYLYILFPAILFSSCASLSKFPGVGRIKTYEFQSQQIPSALMAFVSYLLRTFTIKVNLRRNNLKIWCVPPIPYHPICC